MASVQQENKATPSFSFKEVKKYAQYLLENRLDALAVENMRLSRAHELPLLKLFEHLAEEELLALGRQGLKEFFLNIIEDTALANALFELIRWKEDKLPGIPRNSVQGADLVLSYSIRKQLLLKFLPDYTSDCQVLVAVMQELEHFYIELERNAFEVFVDIQKEELHKKNEFLTSLVYSSEDGIIAFDTEEKITEWNPVAERWFGKSKELVLGQKLGAQFPKLLHTDYYSGLKKALQGERMQLNRQQFINRGGWFNACLVPLFDSNGRVQGALSVLYDVTEALEQEEILKEHQEELQASNEELQESLAQLEETQEILRTAVEQLEEAQAIAQLGNWEYDVQRNLVFWSKELRRIYGIGEDDLNLTYNTYLDMIHPDDRQMVATAVARCFEDHQPYHFEHRIVRKDGSIGWLLAHGKATVSAGGKLIRLSGTGKDVTERKQAELKIQEEQHFIKKVTDTTPDIITVFDLERRMNIYGNRQLYDVLGYSSEEVEEYRRTLGNQWVYTMLHPEDLPRFFAFIEGLRSQTGNETREIEYRGKTKAGKYLWVLGRYSAFKRNEAGQVTQVIGITRDITERKKAEQLILDNEARLRELNSRLEEQVASRTRELTRKNQQLMRINADLDNFIYTASHDLKAPIANLEGLLMLLDSKIKLNLSERELELLNMIHQSVSRFKKTIKDLTDIAHMQKELEEETAENVAFEPLLEDIKADIRNLIEQTDTQLETDLQLKEIGYNRKNLRSVMHNLLTNALKYRHPNRKPQVHISTKRLGDYVILRVRDNGLGIPEKQHEKIFSLFKRLHKDVEGSGMGLYIVKRIIENSGGRIEVDSKPEKGSIFTLYLKDQSVHES